MDTISRLANLVNVSRLQNLSGAGEVLHHPNILFAVIIGAILILYGLSVGRTRALVSLLALYAAYTLTILFPFLDWAQTNLPETFQPATAVAVFIGLYLLSFLIISRAVARHRLSAGELSLSGVAGISLVQLGLMAAMAVSLLPPDLAQHYFGPTVKFLGGSYALFIWAAAALVAVLLLRVRHRRD